MARMTRLFPLLALALLAACASGPPVAPGETEAAARVKMGPPAAIHRLADGTFRYEYSPGPFGQHAWMAQFGVDGRLATLEQVRSEVAFGRIRTGVSDKAAVLATLGRPSEVSRVRLHDYEVWSYRYKENGVWDSMMHVHFDEAGIVRLMQSGPDPLYEKRDFFAD